MPLVFKQLSDLADAIRNRVGRSGIVGVDGWTGVGKTTLARALASALGGSCYDLDGALTHDQGRYVSALRVPEVCEALARAERPFSTALPSDERSTLSQNVAPAHMNLGTSMCALRRIALVVVFGFWRASPHPALLLSHR